MFVLDTNVVSELRKEENGKADRNVTRWISRADPRTLFLSTITVMELEVGVRLMERRDRAQGLVLRAWLDGHVLLAFADRILTIDTAVARVFGALHVPDRRGDQDALIAATALVHRMAVVTRNVGDFAPMEVPVVNPWLA